PDTTFTVRWYLRSSAVFDSAFISRPQTVGVGFFTTDTAANVKIKRWSMARFGDAGVKYYVKHVPTEWQPAFASAFDQWNETFQQSFGRKIFDYEFVPENDARNALLVPGDIRYNIVEWDLVNKATYGGLGPSEGNNYTGEIINANVLIQGPTVMKLYTSWYKVSETAANLRAIGKSEEAAVLLRDFMKASDAKLEPTQLHRLTLNKTKNFVIRAEQPELADPHTQRNDFEEVPQGVDFKTYMNGYFHDMLTHELGHNLGLRHNFRGNMGAKDTGEKGSTSRSIMEYLGRRYRYLDQVGEYDVMAIQYGYAGTAPTHLDWFCTDEDKWAPKTPGSSPECSSDDATSDPYSFFEFRLARTIDYLTARGESYAPVWTQENMKRELNVALNGLLGYASIDVPAAEKITNFFGKSGRPADAKGMSTFVVARVKQQLCDPNLEMVIAGKYDPAAKALTLKQIQGLRETAVKAFADGGVDLGIDINCAPLQPVAASHI
ncbi:MAG: zinc-dependent metalloprotease, partial [Bdellovibrionales bacterium]|nr:zinc-dependent metalloprotease [Oligoflexia bacterium]